MQTQIRANRTAQTALAILLCTFLAHGPAGAEDSSQVKALFAKPPREYASAPLWTWNDMLTEEQIRGTMRDLAAQQVKQVFVHPRPGLMTPYLSPDWFRLWKVALDEAERLDMNVWIYDENSYPSGFAGGWVPELMPESRGRGLHLREAKAAPKWSEDLLAVYRRNGEGLENVTKSVKDGTALPEGRYVVASVRRAGNSPWHGGRCYVDLLYPGVTEKFLEVTHEAYRREIGRQFGNRVPGCFTDEPQLRPAGGLPWTDDLPQVFQKRWDYDLLEHLPSLIQPVGDWRKVRHNYYQVLLDLFIDRWGKPYYDYCDKHGLEFTGHYWEHDWPNCRSVPDNMAMSAWQHRPGIDTLMNQYREDTHAQFGNVRSVREIASVANQLGRKRTLCEIYGAGGWDLRFEDMKRIGDWLQVLGVNTLDQHLSYVTIRGARKRDHPQSFSYHEPWWEAYHVSAGYFARLTAALSHGEQINRILVIEPTTTAWMYQGDGKLKGLGDSFFNLLMALEAAQVEYDIGCEDVMARHGSVEAQELRIGRRAYHTVVLPPQTENLNNQTVKLLEGFLNAGGRLLACDEAPVRVDGSPSQRAIALSKSAGWKQIDAKTLPDALRQLPSPDGFAVTRRPDDQGILFHHRRRLDDGELLFLVNTSIESPSRGAVAVRAGGVEQWNLRTGKSEAYPFEVKGGRVLADFQLPPCGSLLLFLSKNPLKPAPVRKETAVPVAAAGPMEIRRSEPNVLTLDFVDVTAAGESKTNAYCYQAGQFAFRKNGMPRNPWDSAVQFRNEIISRTFPADSGFTATYRFTIEEAAPKSLSIVIERPDLYTITCNGKPVSAARGTWWLDKAFGRIDIASAARVGENVVTIKASPFTIYHELEPAYVLGDFALKPTNKGFVIVPDRPLDLGRWNEQGHPFYAAGVAYRRSFQLDRPAGRYVVALPSWYGSVAKVLVNGRVAGYITAPPWECDVTEQVKADANTVEVVVIGTLKNTLGPHHGKPGLGSAWPGSFHRGPDSGPPPGSDYHTVGYGLFEPFALKSVRTDVAGLSR